MRGVRMKLIIEIPEYVIDDMKECGFIPEEDNEELCKAIDNGTPIPDNATNGDVVNTLFSNTFDNFCERTTWEWNRWWRTPYQKGGNK